MKTINIREIPLSEIIDLPVHPAAACFPMLEKNTSKREEGDKTKQTVTLAELADSINKFGLQEPIVLYQSDDDLVLLDGRNRREACVMAAKALGVDHDEFLVTVEDFEGTNAEAKEYVKTLNLDRRDLDATARATSAVKWWEMEAATRQQGARTDLSPNLGRSEVGTAESLAAEFRVSRSYIEDIRQIHRKEQEARRRAEEAAQRAEEYELEEEEAKLELEEAKSTGDREKLQVAATKANNASMHKAEEREKAAELAIQASKQAALAEALHTGKKKLGEVRGDKKRESVENDPIGHLKTQVNQNVSNLKKIITELATLTAKGDEIYDFLGTRFQNLCDHLQDEFEIEQAFDCYVPDEET